MSQKKKSSKSDKTAKEEKKAAVTASQDEEQEETNNNSGDEAVHDQDDEFSTEYDLFVLIIFLLYSPPEGWSHAEDPPLVTLPDLKDKQVYLFQYPENVHVELQATNFFFSLIFPPLPITNSISPQPILQRC